MNVIPDEVRDMTPDDVEAAIREMSMITDEYKAEFRAGGHRDDPRTALFMQYRREDQHKVAEQVRRLIADLDLDEYFAVSGFFDRLPDAAVCKIYGALCPEENGDLDRWR